MYKRLNIHNPYMHHCGDQMTERRQLLPFAMATGLLVLVSGPCLAQVSAFGWDPNTAQLTDQDWHLLWEGIASLNRAPGAAAGETRAWSNAASGDLGKVTLTRVFESKGMTCHALNFAISYSQKPAPQDYNFNWCRTSSGEWRIAS